jgi:sigma-B regulation protein RsbU (phosphoserine phosphatase)
LPLRRSTLCGEAGAAHEAGGSAGATGRDQVFGVLCLDSQIAKGGFDRIDQDILESLATDASAAIENARLLREVDENRRMQEEMERAREIQKALLPDSFWTEPYFVVAGSCVPSRRLGGDYLDQFRLPDGRCCLVIADVSGKGLPAALLAAGLQGALGAEVMREQPLADMIERVNHAVSRRTPLGKYVTFFCCVLSDDGTLTYVNAGHVPPIALQRAPGEAAGRMRQLFTGDMALGIQESSRYHVGTLQLQPGESVVLYTDGVTEATNLDGEFYEESRLERIIDRIADCPAEEMLKTIINSVETFTHHAPPADDITLLVLKYVGLVREPGIDE